MLNTSNKSRFASARGALSQFGGQLFGVAVGVIATPVFAYSFGLLDTAIAGYPEAILYSASAFFLLVAAFDIILTRHNLVAVFLLYLAIAVAFLVVSSFLTPTQKEQSTAIILAWIMAFVIRMLIFFVDVQDQYDASTATGFASAGVLVVTRPDAKPYFVLVHNKNLRKGAGLWVPPGGHVDPSIERPDMRLIEKISSETGYACSIMDERYNMMPPDPSRWESKACVWLVPPDFLLREDLMGECSKGHVVHIDLCYICVSDGNITNTAPKYSGDEVAEVVAADCIGDFASAQTAITNAIDETNRRSQGLSPGLYDDLTQDVIWRLHLAAKYLSQNGKIDV